MSDHLELTFKLEGFTPETMPMQRLGEYMVEIAQIYGEDVEVRFIAQNEGSLEIAHTAKAPNLFARIDKLKELHQKNNTTAASKALSKIQKLLDEDDTSARLLNSNNFNIISFPRKNTNTAYSKPIIVNEHTEIDGKITAFSGENKYTVRVKQSNKEILDCKIESQELAKQIATHYLDTLRFQGDGVWERSSEGEWKLLSFTITSFLKLKNQTLEEAFKELRAITEGGWIDPDNLLFNLQQEREDA